MKLLRRIKCKLGFHKYIKWPTQKPYIVLNGTVATYHTYETTFEVCKYCHYSPNSFEDVEVIQVRY